MLYFDLGRQLGIQMILLFLLMLMTNTNIMFCEQSCNVFHGHQVTTYENEPEICL